MVEGEEVLAEAAVGEVLLGEEEFLEFAWGDLKVVAEGGDVGGGE